jgi:pyridoxamine 5'-phosphate oxidase
MNTLHAMEASDLDPDPLRQFQVWFEEARDAGIEVPESMALATAGADGRPSVRMVLLKGVDELGFSFHTNYESRKGDELAANPHAALLFYWQPLGRQIRVEGLVERLPAEASDAYFRSRPLGSRLAAWASPQSRPLADRDELERLNAAAAARFAGDDVPRPPYWGGFRLVPAAYEFWQHAENRLHDRIRYERDGDVWNVELLAP